MTTVPHSFPYSARDITKRTVLEWRDRPDYFAETAFEFGHMRTKIHLWSKQRELMRAVAEHGHVSARSGHKTGKSFSCAMLAWNWTMCHADSKVIMIAPSYKQLNNILWTDVKRVGNSMVVSSGARIYQSVADGVKYPDGRSIFGFTGKTKKEDAAGFSGKILYICDEASGLSNDILDVVSTVPNGKVVCISNPTIPYGGFYLQHQPGSSWHPIHLSSLDAARENLRENGTWRYENLANMDWIERCRQDYQEGSYFWQVRVEGNFPSSSLDTVITNQVALAALNRINVSTEGDIHIGVDVARFGEDSSAMVVRRGYQIEKVRSYKKEDNVQIATRIGAEIERWMRDTCQKIHVKIDCTNGGGVFDILRDRYKYEPRVNLVSVMYQASSTSPHYVRMRDQLWFDLAAWLESASIPQKDIADDIRSQLVCARFSYSPDGKRKVESKDELKKRVHKSPDIADAMALCVHHVDPGDTICSAIAQTWDS